ncbi:sigma factor-binding protein Crl [Proteus sp. FME41]|uniref:sigma factor-binding protein Crl n=1 Tax=Proteus sp. FME41 TaxID=2742608 RepID=UPI001866C1C9|nr:sigma factor-binding protein Crl [Proteus sp. FME41]
MTSSLYPTRGKLLKRFAQIGPYIREQQCQESQFFFDCLAVCVNKKVVPEKREFWGWWMNLERDNGQLIYSYQIGLFDKNGDWIQQNLSKNDVIEPINETLIRFHAFLQTAASELNMTLIPDEKMNKFPLPIQP